MEAKPVNLFEAFHGFGNGEANAETGRRSLHISVRQAENIRHATSATMIERQTWYAASRIQILNFGLEFEEPNCLDSRALCEKRFRRSLKRLKANANSSISRGSTVDRPSHNTGESPAYRGISLID